MTPPKVPWGRWVALGGRGWATGSFAGRLPEITHHSTHSRTRHQSWYRFAKAYKEGKPHAVEAMAILREHNFDHYMDIMHRGRNIRGLT